MADDTPAAKPAPISRRIRFEILRRDGHTCRYCGAQAPDVPLTVDHVIPRALGGSDDTTNLVTACRDCNYGKGSTSPDEHIVADVDAASLLFAKAMERAAAIRHAELAGLGEMVDKFDDAWRKWFWKDYEEKHEIERDKGWRDSIVRFIENGLSVDDLLHFMHIAMNSKVRHDGTWRYFCGCCWKELANRQELARRLIEEGQV